MRALAGAASADLHAASPLAAARRARQALGWPEAVAEFIRRYSSMRADLRSFRTAHCLQELVEMFRPAPPPASIGMPVLVLLSSGGTFADPRRTRQLVDGFPRGLTQTVTCHHWPLTERPHEVRQAIEAWCAAQRWG